MTFPPSRYHSSKRVTAKVCRLCRARHNRHTFAVRRLLRWYEEGADIGQKMLALSTYLGHARISDTYWYLTGVPELMAIASKRFEPNKTQGRQP